MITKIGLYRNPRKKKTWVVRWFGEYDLATGKQKRYSKSFKKKRDAEAFKLQKEVEFGEGQRRDRPEEITLKDFCRSYMECLNLRPETVKLYDNTNRWLLDYFGGRTLLRQITPLTAERFIILLKPLRGKGELSTSTRHRFLRNSRTMFNKAVAWEILNRNTFANITNQEVVRVLAGHSDLRTTMQYYCQIDSDQRAKAAAAIDDLLEQTDARMTPGAHSG